MNIIQQMIDDKIAKNIFQATHIANGLNLIALKTDEEKIARYKLYRKWRDAGEPPSVAYANAIEGKQPLEFFETATGSDGSLRDSGE